MPSWLYADDRNGGRVLVLSSQSSHPPRTAVPALSTFQTQAASNRILAFVMGLIDGKRSITDIAKLLESQQLIQQQEAEGVIRDFMIRMYEDSGRSS